MNPMKNMLPLLFSLAPTPSVAPDTQLHSRRDGWQGGVSHTKRGTGRLASYQANGWRKPGAAAARKRLRKLTGANRLGL